MKTNCVCVQCLMYYVDNVNDAVLFANMFNTLFQLRTDQGKNGNGKEDSGTSYLTGVAFIGSWTPPPSWDFLFGTPFNQELYQ